jgi:hypothetical protein
MPREFDTASSAGSTKRKEKPMNQYPEENPLQPSQAHEPELTELEERAMHLNPLQVAGILGMASAENIPLSEWEVEQIGTKPMHKWDIALRKKLAQWMNMALESNLEELTREGMPEDPLADLKL